MTDQEALAGVSVSTRWAVNETVKYVIKFGGFQSVITPILITE